MRNEKIAPRVLKIILNPFYDTKYLKQIFSLIIGPFDLKVTINVLKNGKCQFSLKKKTQMSC